MNKVFFSLLILFSLWSCVPNENKEISINTYGNIVSKFGHTAYVSESTSKMGVLTQVLINFSGGSCGSGAISANQIDLNINLHWSKPEELTITIPKDVNYIRNASGEHLKCGKHTVHVIVASETNA